MENFHTSWAALKRGKVLRACTSTLAAIFIMTNFGASSSALAQGEGEGGGQADLATQSQNPIASLISLPFEFDSYQNVGEEGRTQNTILFKPTLFSSLPKKFHNGDKRCCRTSGVFSAAVS